MNKLLAMRDSRARLTSNFNKLGSSVYKMTILFQRAPRNNEPALKNYSSKLLAGVSYPFDNNRRLIGNTLFLGNCSTDL